MAQNGKSRSKRSSEEDELDAAYRHLSGVKGKYSKRSPKSHKSAMLAICIAIAAVVICIAAAYQYYVNAGLDGIILENVTVAGVDVGGMSQADAIIAVQAATGNTYTAVPMVVTVMESHAEIPVSYVGKLDVRSAVKAAYKFGNSGSAAKRQQEQNIAMSEGYKVDLTPYLDLNENGIRSILSDLGAKYSSTLSQSTYKITGNAPSQSLIITLGVPEYGLDLNKLYQQVLDAYSDNSFEVIGQCGMIEPEPIDLKTIYDQHYTAPIDAYYDKSTREIVNEINGYGFDLEEAKKVLSKVKYGSSVEIPFSVIKPEITAEQLSSMLFQDTLATYTGNAQSDTGRDKNLRLTCEAIDGLVLYPEDVFSFNDTLGECTTARGFHLTASDFENKMTADGISQVASALYYCALKAEIQIILRDNHIFMPTYMPVGLDAFVSWDSTDFRFKNTLDYPVRIEASAAGGNTTISLIGTDLRDYRVELEPEIISTTAYSTTYETISANNADGYKHGDYITKPYTGYDVKTYLCRYDLHSDTLISKDLVAHSVYDKQDAVICRIEGNDLRAGNHSGIGGGITDADGNLPE